MKYLTEAFVITRSGSAVITLHSTYFSLIYAGVSYANTLAALLIAFFAHVYGFMLNDYFDYELDKKAGKDRVLRLNAVGLNRPRLLILSILSSFIGFVFAVVFFSFGSAMLFLLAVALAGYYNARSKYGSHPRLFAEISLASSVAVLILSFYPLVGPQDLNEFYLSSLGFGLVLLFLNAIPSSLKDVYSDDESGVISIAHELGVKIDGSTHLIGSIFRLTSLGLFSLVIAVSFFRSWHSDGGVTFYILYVVLVFPGATIFFWLLFVSKFRIELWRMNVMTIGFLSYAIFCSSEVGLLNGVICLFGFLSLYLVVLRRLSSIVYGVQAAEK